MLVKFGITESAHERLEKKLEGLDKDAKKELKEVRNQIATQVKNRLYSAVKKEYTINGSEFKKEDLKKKNATLGKPYAEITIKGDVPTLYKAYKTRGNKGKNAAKAEVRKRSGLKPLMYTNGSKMYKAFLTEMPNGKSENSHVGIFQRVPGTQMAHAPRNKNGRQVKREKIEEKSGMSKSKASEKVYEGLDLTDLQEILHKHVARVVGGG